MYAYAQHVCLVPREVSCGHLTPWSWSYFCDPLCRRWESNPGPLKEQQTSALNHWASSLVPKQ